MNTTTTITNETNGVITRITVINAGHFNYHWLILAMVASGLLAWALRKVFWGEDSN
jgi:hypothetical protein